MPELRIAARRAHLSHAERTTIEQSQEDSMTRAELGRTAMQELAERRGIADREWLASLLDRALELGHAEMRDRVASVYGRDAAESATQTDEWNDRDAMREHMPILMPPSGTMNPLYAAGETVG
jgi:hypothetical protein